MVKNSLGTLSLRETKAPCEKQFSLISAGLCVNPARIVAPFNVVCLPSILWLCNTLHCAISISSMLHVVLKVDTGGLCVWLVVMGNMSCIDTVWAPSNIEGSWAGLLCKYTERCVVWFALMLCNKQVLITKVLV